jgi:hypothetical protein
MNHATHLRGFPIPLVRFVGTIPNTIQLDATGHVWMKRSRALTRL